MAFEVDLTVCDPTFALTKEPKPRAMFHFQVIDQLPEGPKRSGKYIRLGMTATDAMNLLALLQGANKILGVPVPDVTVTMTDVPPAKDQN